MSLYGNMTGALSTPDAHVFQISLQLQHEIFVRRFIVWHADERAEWEHVKATPRTHSSVPDDT